MKDGSWKLFSRTAAFVNFAFYREHESTLSGKKNSKITNENKNWEIKRVRISIYTGG